MKPNYAARRRSIASFNGVLYVCGALLNVFAVASVIGWAARPAAKIGPEQRARVEFEDPSMCTRHMSGRKFVRGTEEAVDARASAGRAGNMWYRSQSTYGRTKEGHSIEMVGTRYDADSKATGILFLVVNANETIESCLSPYTYPMNRNRKLECLAAAGEYRPSGECRLEVNQPSDCTYMSGTLSGSSCLVPAGNQILRASASQAQRHACVKPDCETQ